MLASIPIVLLTASFAFLPAQESVTQAVRPTSSGPVSCSDEIPKGQIVDRLVCANDGTQSYALYLPSSYTSTRQWPILYAFDPGARGKTPVERFKEAAEKYGWIVIGSNNSRNGPMNISLDAGKAVWKDTHERFAIDERQTYVTGFSGGARVAIFFASFCHDCIAGVIACSAGFPEEVTPSSALHFLFFGTAGVDDFNFAEMKSLAEPLMKAGITQRIEVFSGRHEWPPASLATQAIEWLQLQAMKAGKLQLDEGFIDALWRSESQRANTLEESKKTYDAYLAYVVLIDSFKGLRDVGEVAQRVSQLRDSREVKDALRDERQQLRKQRELESQIGGLVSPREATSDEGFESGHRLRAIIADLQKSSKAVADTGERRVARRVLGSLSIGLFEQGRNLLQAQNRSGEAVRKLELAIEVNPERAGAYFYLAWAYALSGDKRKSLQALRTAVEKGFTDVGAITDNKAFDPVRKDPQYQQIIQSLQRSN
jgi:predicted esterase